AGCLHGPAVLRVDVREGEEVEVLDWLEVGVSLDEEVGDEAALVVHVATGRAAEQRIAGVAEVSGKHRLAATKDHLLISDDLAPALPGRFDLGRGPGQAALPPLVVLVRPGLAKHDVFEPVGARPAAGGAACEAD